MGKGIRAVTHPFYNREFYIIPGANFISLEPEDINPSSVLLGKEKVKPGDRITFLGQGKGKSKARTHEIEEGHFLEYRGIFEGEHLLVIFAVDGKAEEKIYSCFYYVDPLTLIFVTGRNTVADIRPEIVRFYEEEAK